MKDKVKAALIFDCCSVSAWGYTTEVCWYCESGKARDAWLDSVPDDNDAMLTRKYIRTTDMPLRSSI